ncbi:hypothetical protein NA56DRAFT_394665 [Hyaloscypha hepaticicola]|uniref:Uncharacterized protein n=1 Tax=Hyaloscypha hepaticicola TaxID=2082293 RepID=A0A2J6PJU8_9HELO|nr:hypothetical protein NA56DRAFT_394665 [Hyaloscypha hepaticicola]
MRLTQILVIVVDSQADREEVSCSSKTSHQEPDETSHLGKTGHQENASKRDQSPRQALSFNTPPLARYDCPVDPSALSIPMLTRNQGNTSTSAYTLNDTEGRHANGQATGQAGSR